MASKRDNSGWVARAGAAMLTAAILGDGSPAVAAVPVGTAFTYSGELQQGGSPVDDMCDFEFSLWDDPGTPPGIQVGSTLSQSIDVADGRFDVALDFGPDIFTGQARWLEIAVCCPAPCGPPTTLIPRQELTPAPYSLHAPSAESVPWSGLTGVPLGFADDIDNDTLEGLSCVGGQLAKWDGAAWVCDDDIDTDTDTTYDGTDFALSNQSCTLAAR